MDEPGLRELKKSRTRDTIVRVAMARFFKDGFEATTIADIAADADIAPRTFFGYFAAKEDVVFHEFDEAVEELAAHLRARDPAQDALEAMREWILERHMSERRHDEEFEAQRHRLVVSTPALEARERVQLARFEALLREAVAEDLGVPASALRPHLVAAAAIAALRALGERHKDGPPPEDPADPAAVLDEALTFLRGGLDALRAR